MLQDLGDLGGGGGFLDGVINYADLLNDLIENGRPLNPNPPRNENGGPLNPNPPRTAPPVIPFNIAQWLPNVSFAFRGDRSSLENALLALAASTAGMEAAQRNALFSAIFPALLPFLTEGGEGFSPVGLAALRAQAVEGVNQQFAGAEESLKTELARRGLRTNMTPISGESVRRIAELAGARARAGAGALRGVNIANEQQRLQNLFNALNIAAGHPANPAAAINAFSSLANTQQQEPGSLGGAILASLLGAAASAAGQTLGNQLGRLFGGGGSSGGLRLPAGVQPTFPGGGSSFPCWVAAELYGGWDAPRTIQVRRWLMESEIPSVQAFLAMYREIGQFWAEAIKHDGKLRLATKKLFDSFPIS
jgi:hypothetical protein